MRYPDAGKRESEWLWFCSPGLPRHEPIAAKQDSRQESSDRNQSRLKWFIYIGVPPKGELMPFVIKSFGTFGGEIEWKTLRIVAGFVTFGRYHKTW
jgi:hypothetical protein